MGTRNHKTGSKIGRFEQCSSLAPDPSKTPAPAVSQNAPCCDAQSAATAISASPIPDLILDGEFTGGLKNRHRSSDNAQKITNQGMELKRERIPPPTAARQYLFTWQIHTNPRNWGATASALSLRPCDRCCPRTRAIPAQRCRRTATKQEMKQAIEHAPCAQQAQACPARRKSPTARLSTRP